MSATATRESPISAAGLLRVSEAAIFLGVAESYLYRLIYRGDIPTVRLGRARRVPRSALVEYAEARLVQKDAS